MLQESRSIDERHDEIDNNTKMNSAQDPLRSNTFGNARETSIDQPHDAAAFRTILTHDRHLSAGVHERLHVVSIHFTVLNAFDPQSPTGLPDTSSYDVEHNHVSENFRCMFHRMFHIFLNVLHSKRNVRLETGGEEKNYVIIS